MVGRRSALSGSGCRRSALSGSGCRRRECCRRIELSKKWVTFNCRLNELSGKWLSEMWVDLRGEFNEFSTNSFNKFSTNYQNHQSHLTVTNYRLFRGRWNFTILSEIRWKSQQLNPVVEEWGRKPVTKDFQTLHKNQEVSVPWENISKQSMFERKWLSMEIDNLTAQKC